MNIAIQFQARTLVEPTSVGLGAGPNGALDKFALESQVLAISKCKVVAPTLREP
jgi:hypothetical protein